MNRIKINFNRFSCPDNKKTIIKKHEEEVINANGDKEKILVCDIFLESLKGVRYDGTNKKEAMLALFGANSFEEMKEIANGEKSMMDIIQRLEDLLEDEEFVEEYKEEVKDKAYKQGYDDGFDDGAWAEKVIISRRLINKDFDYEFISEITNLSTYEMKRIERDLS